jgi:DNA-binding response OmpR family regulator
MLPSETPRGLVLVVDDDQRFLALVGATLVDSGWAVCTAVVATEAMRAVQTVSPDIVVLDLVMPDIDGLELARQIRTARPDQRIVVFSSLFDQRVAAQTAELGLDYLEKADGPERLLTHLDALVG